MLLPFAKAQIQNNAMHKNAVTPSARGSVHRQPVGSVSSSSKSSRLGPPGACDEPGRPRLADRSAGLLPFGVGACPFVDASIASSLHDLNPGAAVEPVPSGGDLTHRPPAGS